METIQQLPLLLKWALVIGTTVALGSFVWFVLEVGRGLWLRFSAQTDEERWQQAVERLEVRELQRVLKGQRVTRRSYRRQMQELQEHVDAIERSIREGQQP